MKTPDTFFLVTVNFPELGFGSANDVTADWGRAVDDYSEHDEARIFRLEMDADNMPAGFTDVTDEAEATIAKRLGYWAA